VGNFQIGAVGDPRRTIETRAERSAVPLWLLSTKETGNHFKQVVEKGMTKIVVLDGYTLNPGDLSWDGLHALGDCQIFDRTSADLIVPRARQAEIVLTNKTVLSREILAQLPKLKYIGVLATGYNVVDVVAARQRGIPVTHVPTYGTRSVAQMTFALLLELTQHVGHHARTVCEGRWSASQDFCYWDYPLVELEGLTMGLIGLGRIGRATAGLAKAFGMRVIGHDPLIRSVEDIEWTDLESLLRTSDVVSLHCPLTEDNERLIDARRLGLMKSTAFLLNTSRGPLIDERALADALNAGRLAGAGLDVLAVEPPRDDNPLLGAKSCLITPHIAWATRAARQRLLDTALANLRAFQQGRSENVVNG
jgi:glycerate dehydrogenase